VRRVALYAGGFLGPFGGGVLTVLVPDLRAEFGVSTAVASAVIPAYIVPFAALQLVSGADEFGLSATARGLILWTGLNTLTVEAAPRTAPARCPSSGPGSSRATRPAQRSGCRSTAHTRGWAFAVAGAVCATVTTVIRKATRALRT
jgi:hypothetical protein